MAKGYSEEEITTFIEHAQELGIGRARRELGYPKSWITGRKWCDARGVDVSLDEVMSKAAATQKWYQNEEKLLVCQEGLERIHEQLLGGDLTPDDIKKLSDASKRFVETMNLIEGRATSISRDESGAGDDLFNDALREFEQASLAIVHKDV